MPQNNFRFKQFTVSHDKCAFKVGTDGVLLGAAVEVPASGYILDIGTGSGLIALMLAQRSEAEIIAIEPDKDSFEQAALNFRNSPWRDRIHAVWSTLQDYEHPTLKFDLIVSNPPYFTEFLKNPDERKAMARHSDSLGYAELLSGVDRLLAPEGILGVIYPYAEGTVFIANAAGKGLYCFSIIKVRPTLASPVKRLILMFSRKRIQVKERFLTIEKGLRGDYTADYVELTKDFYLKF